MPLWSNGKMAGCNPAVLGSTPGRGSNRLKSQYGTITARALVVKVSGCWADKGIVNIVISVPWTDRDGKGQWKEPFKKLKLSKIRAEDEWNILLRVDGREAKRIYKLTAGLVVETVMEKVVQETWAEKTAHLSQKRV